MTSHVRRPTLLLAGLALTGLATSGCGGGDEYEPLPPTNEYAVPAASFCADLTGQLAGEAPAGTVWKLTEIPPAEVEATESGTATPSGTASGEPSASTAPVEDLANGFCALTATVGSGAEQLRLQVVLSAISATKSEARRLYEQASSQVAAQAELNFDARPGDVPGTWQQSTRAELVKAPSNPDAKVPVDLHDLVVDGTLHAQVKIHITSVRGSELAATRTVVGEASEAVLTATTGLLLAGTTAD